MNLIRTFLAQAPNLRDDQLGAASINLAAELLAESQRGITSSEANQGAKLARMMDDARGKAMTMAMNDQAFRSQRPARTLDQLGHLVGRFGVPRYLEAWERAALGLGVQAGRVLPGVVLPQIVRKLRAETARVILPADDAPLTRYLAARKATGTRLNLNRLGEAILGEEEAARRFAANLALLNRDDVNYISVKISSICSQIHPAAYDHTLHAVQERLRALYREAMQHATFVNLDMEEYRDLRLTVDAFMRTLDEPEFHGMRAGIVLQAYLPDSHPIQRELTTWAITRVAVGGAPIKLRIVKGANLAMERVDAALHGWPQATYDSKHAVDANYKRMLHYGCLPAHARAVNLGVASHNLFDIAHALLLRARHGVQAAVEFEMLEGMANHQARVVQAAAGGLLLYAPVVLHADFGSAIAYLVRRLDENTADENFLRDLFGMRPGSPSWDRQRVLFEAALRDMHLISEGPQRVQDRASERMQFDVAQPFANAPDTDWSLKHNADWMHSLLAQRRAQPALHIALPVAQVGHVLPRGEGQDPARPAATAYSYDLASPDEIEAALRIAVAARALWQAVPLAERSQLLLRCAAVLAQRRGQLITCMVLDGGKAIEQGDVEVSEAIDFANYYARAFDDIANEAVGFKPLGTVLITPPWNFPLAIPAGGVLAALMAGNSVILKPAPEAVLIAWELCNALWDAGIPRDVLQFLPTTDDSVGRSLVTDDRVSAVILTGAYSTAQMFLSWKPNLKLFAETSGKNALIITGMADKDAAIKDLVKSAFGHNGQKCSAASLAILEAEVYDDPAFLRQLRDAAASLPAGSAWQAHNVITPLIRAPGEALLRALTTLDAGETWLLEPRQSDDNLNLWTPGIKLGVTRGSWYHRTECFGPVLGLMRARDLADAIEIANDNEFGLTAGLHSLDDREIAQWRAQIQAGNAYINRGTTGAIVQRQPFGGWKRSVFGEAKAGGPNYVWQLGRWLDDASGPVPAFATLNVNAGDAFGPVPAFATLNVNAGDASVPVPAFATLDVNAGDASVPVPAFATLNVNAGDASGPVPAG